MRAFQLSRDEIRLLLTYSEDAIYHLRCLKDDAKIASRTEKDRFRTISKEAAIGEALRLQQKLQARFEDMLIHPAPEKPKLGHYPRCKEGEHLFAHASHWDRMDCCVYCGLCREKGKVLQAMRRKK
jgi:hypothetical protein